MYAHVQSQEPRESLFSVVKDNILSRKSLRKERRERFALVALNLMSDMSDSLLMLFFKRATRVKERIPNPGRHFFLLLKKISSNCKTNQKLQNFVAAFLLTFTQDVFD